MQLLLLQSVSTALVNAGYALLVGSLAARRWLGTSSQDQRQGQSLGDSGQAQGREIDRMLRHAMAFGFIVATGALLMTLWQASATMADVPLLESGPDLWRMFAGTSYGRFGLASLVILAAGAAVHLGLRRRWHGPVYMVVVSCMLLAFAVCRVATGHAAENGLASIATAVELIHVLSMALWCGIVFVAAWLTLPDFGRSGMPGRIGPYLASVSRWATVALVGVLSTGLYNAFRVLRAPADLIGTDYGWVLTAKLCLVGVAIALGGWNRLIGFPAVHAAAMVPGTARNPLSSIRFVLRIESVVLFTVLLAAAVLTASAPPTSN